MVKCHNIVGPWRKIISFVIYETCQFIYWYGNLTNMTNQKQNNNTNEYKSNISIASTSGSFLRCTKWCICWTVLHFAINQIRTGIEMQRLVKNKPENPFQSYKVIIYIPQKMLPWWNKIKFILDSSYWLSSYNSYGRILKSI